MNDTHWSLGFASSGRRNRTFISCFKGRRPTVSRSPRVLCESRTRLARLEAWSLCRSAKSTLLSAEGERVELSRLIARPLSKRLPSPIGLPFRSSSCGGRNRTCDEAINSRPPVPAQDPPHQVRTTGFEPAFSCFRNTRDARTSPRPEVERLAGLEPAIPAWQASTLPLRHRRLLAIKLSKIIRAPGRTRTGVAAVRERSLRR